MYSVVFPHPDVEAVQPVGVVAGESAGPDAALTVQPSMATHKYILGLLGYISGSVKLLVSQDGEVFLVLIFGLSIIP